MFDLNEIRLMNKIGLTLDFSFLSDDDLVKIEDVVGDFYTKEAQKTDTATKEILLCESILDKL